MRLPQMSAPGRTCFQLPSLSSLGEIMRYRSLRFGRRTLLQFIFSFLAVASCSAQFNPATPPAADPADTRFQSVTEDWNSPSLSGSHLTPAQPLVAPFDDTDKYEVQLIELQWR